MIFRSAKRCIACVLAVSAALASVAGCSSSPPAAPASSGKSYAFWPLPPDEPRIQFLGAFNSSEDVSPTRTSDLEKIVFGSDAVRPAFVNKPYGVAIKDGRIYICDIRAKAVVVMDLAKKQTRLIGVNGAGRLERPVAIAVADDDRLYVADGIHQAILVYDRDERLQFSYSIPKLKPGGIACAGKRLYVSDLERQAVLMIDRETGKEIGVIGSVGDEDGQFRLPIGVSTDTAGNVYVVDMMRCRVQKFTADGAFLATMGEPGDHAGGFARPKHLAVDRDGIVYVVDAGFQNVQMFNDKFQLLMHFGAAGDFPGAMNLPVGIAVSDTGLEYFRDRLHPGFAAKRLIVVANQFGDGKIGVYALGDRRPEFSVADLNSHASPVSTGVAEPTPEMLKFQNIGGVEPGPEDAVPERSAEEPAPPKGTPATPPRPVKQ